MCISSVFNRKIWKQEDMNMFYVVQCLRDIKYNGHLVMQVDYYSLSAIGMGSVIRTTERNRR